MLEYTNKQNVVKKTMKNRIKFDYTITLVIIVFAFLLFTTLQLTAQEKNKKDSLNNRPIHNKTKSEKSIKSPNAPQATGDNVSVKDDAGNVLMLVTDEGSAGSIKLNDAGAVTPNANKLYNNGGNLYWNGSQLSTGASGGATQINDLSDAKYDGSSLFIGENAGASDDGTTNSNTALGRSSLNSNTSGYFNTATGFQTLVSNTSGNLNTANGYDALFSNTVGIHNTANGVYTLHSNTSGEFNTSTGSNALRLSTTGNNNTATGFSALYSNTVGSYNTAAGHEGLYSNKSGSYGVAIGYESQRYANSTLTQYDNTNTSIGAQSLRGSPSPTNNTGVDNSALGNKALLSNTSGKNNTAVGKSTLITNTTGDYNTGNGSHALYSNTTGNNNVASGVSALYSNTTGSTNTAIGNTANYFRSRNTIIGYEAGRGNALHNKSGNVFLGYQAGYSELGDDKLYFENSNSSSPLIWGDFSNDIAAINGKLGVGTQNPTDNLTIVTAVGGEDAFRIKFSGATKFRVAANGGTAIGVNANPPSNGLYVHGDIENQGGVLHTSDRRFKKNIINIPNALDKLNKINGVFY